MLPTLRTNLRSISSKNKSLQDILKSCSIGDSLLSVEPHQGGIHNTKITLRVDMGTSAPAAQRYVERTHFYNRILLSDAIPQGATYSSDYLEDAIDDLNLQGCDFTTDDVELVGGILTARGTSLGYINEEPSGDICSGATNEIIISPDLDYGSPAPDSVPIIWSVELDGVIIGTNIHSDTDYMEDWLENSGTALSGSYGDSALSVFIRHGFAPTEARVRLIPSRTPTLNPILSGNPTGSVDENGVISFCLSNLNNVSCTPTSMEVVGYTIPAGEYTIKYSLESEALGVHVPPTTHTFTISDQNGSWTSDVMGYEILINILDQHSSITLVGGGGGIAHFHNYSGATYGGNGDVNSDGVILTFIKGDLPNDAFNLFFDSEITGDTVTVISCGESNWAGA